MVAAAGLTVAKIALAGVTGSISVLSDAVHSFTDLIAAAIIFYSLRIAAAPPDKRHRYGHEKVEDMSAVAEGAIVVGAACFVVFRAVERLVSGSEVEQPLIATGVMVVAAMVNLVVALYLRRVGNETESSAVSADAQQLLGDVYSSLAVAAGLFLVGTTGYEWLDPLIALGVAAVVLRIGLRLIAGSTRVLLDEALPQDELSRLEHVLSQTRFANVTGYHRLRTRKAGSRRHIDLHLTLDGSLTLDEAHQVAHDVEAAISQSLPNADVLIHIEPDTEAPAPGTDMGPSDVL